MIQPAPAVLALAACRRGVTAVEYALMGGLLAVAVSLAMVSLTGGLRSAFHTAAAAFPGS